VTVRSPRALAAENLAATMRVTLPADVPCRTASDLPTAIADAETRGGRTIIVGSLFLVGEALSHFGLLEGEVEKSDQ